MAKKTMLPFSAERSAYLELKLQEYGYQAEKKKMFGHGTFFILPLLLILSLLSCSTHPRILFDYDQHEDFSRYRSFRFYSLPSQLASEEGARYFDALKSAVMRELQARGFTWVEDGAEKADLLIAIHTEPRQKFSVTLWGYHYAPYDYYWRSDEYWKGGGIDEHAYPRGTLILDFIRADEEELIWRGVNPECLPAKGSGARLDDILNRAVSEILKTFPLHGK